MNKLKIKIFSICVLNLIAYRSFCQVAPDTILVDFLDINSMAKYKNVIYGHDYVLKIENVNRSIFKIESTVSQQDYNTGLPDIFKGVKLPGYLNLALPSISQGKAMAEASPMRDSMLALIKSNLATINNSNNRIIATVVLNNDMNNLFSSCDRSYLDIQTELISTVNTFLGTSLPDRKGQAAALKSNLEAVIQNAATSNEALDTLVPLYVSNIDLIIKINAADMSPLNKEDPNYMKKMLAYRNAKDKNELLAKDKDSLLTVVAAAAQSVADMKKFRDENKIHDLVNNYNMINYSNFTFTSEPIKIRSDEVKIDIRITSSKQLPCDIPATVGISETYRAEGGLKIDFSTGIFFSGGNPDFMGRDLQYRSVDDSTAIIESRDGGKRLLLSIGALMHIYRRSGSCLNWAISAGLSTSTAFDGLNYLLGGSILLGDENRIVITGGAMLKESKILDKDYKYDTRYVKKDMPGSPPTVKVFPKVGWFISLTYNFSEFTAK